jgi:hypothetical protein
MRLPNHVRLSNLIERLDGNQTETGSAEFEFGKLLEVGRLLHTL